MQVKQHKECFEAVYRKLPNTEVYLTFPLEEIDRYHWGRGPWGNEYYSYYYRRFTCHILNRLDVQEGQRILFVGCGVGSEEKNINCLYRNVELWSIDISEEMIKRAIANHSPSRFAVSLAEALPFPDNSFDRVQSREVIEHVIDPQAMLCEIARVLKPGGVAVITTENRDSISPKNFYNNNIRLKLAKLLGCQIAIPEYKDEAPRLEEMIDGVRNAGLELTEYFWDGALYTSLLLLRRYVNFDVVAWAHWFSCLENNRLLAFWFCDQVKYVLGKDDAFNVLRSEGGDLCYSCVQCRGTLHVLEANGYQCQECAQKYPIIDGIPNLILYGNVQDEVGRDRVFAGGGLRERVFCRIANLLGELYIVVYLLCAWFCTLLVKKNDRRYSHLLPANYVLLEQPFFRRVMSRFMKL